eukprot:3180156-Rhodomonas_salina.2
MATSVQDIALHQYRTSRSKAVGRQQGQKPDALNPPATSTNGSVPTGTPVRSVSTAGVASP